MARVRYQISFRQEDIRHAQALAHLQRQEHKSEYIIECILKAEQQTLLKTTIKEALGECLGSMQFAVRPETKEVAKEVLRIEDTPLPDNGEISPALLQFLDEF